jgi:hypothetical protein
VKREALAFQEEHVHEVTDLGAPKQRAQRVGEDLVDGIDADQADNGLLLVDLRNPLEHEIDDQRLFGPGHQQPPEIGARLDLHRAGADARGRGTKRPHSSLEIAGSREEIEVVGLTMPQVEACKGGAAREEERVREAEELLEQRPLQRGEAARSDQAGPTPSSASARTARTRVGDRDAAPVATRPPGFPPAT